MSKQFEFSDFVDEFRVKFELPESVIAPGYYDDDGEWVQPNTADKLYRFK